MVKTKLVLSKSIMEFLIQHHIYFKFKCQFLSCLVTNFVHGDYMAITLHGSAGNTTHIQGTIKNGNRRVNNILNNIFYRICGRRGCLGDGRSLGTGRLHPLGFLTCQQVSGISGRSGVPTLCPQLPRIWGDPRPAACHRGTQRRWW